MRALKITNTITNRDQKSLDRYLNDISNYDVLSPDEEVNLFKMVKQGDQAALNRIVHHNLRFVVSVAKQYQHMGLWLGDLISEGNIGLIKAAERFDPTRGFKFISYAVWWIRQSILAAINEKSRKIRLPINLKTTTAHILAKKAQIEQVKEREASTEELAAALNISEEKIKKCMDHYAKCKSLDAPLTEDAQNGLVDILADGSIPEPDHKLEVTESIKIQVESLMGQLDYREREVLTMYYGIGFESPKTLQEISDIMEVSRERVRQVRDRALKRLRSISKRGW